MGLSLGSISTEDGFGVYLNSLGKLKMMEGNMQAIPHGVFL